MVGLVTRLDENAKKLSINKMHNLIVYAVVDFLKDKWGIKADIILNKKKSKTDIGEIQLSKDAVNKGVFNLSYDPNVSYRFLLRVLIHEMTHIKQVSKGEFGLSDNGKTIVWKDVFEISVSDYKKKQKNRKEYTNLPWEKEADVNMDDHSIIDSIINSKQWNSLKGKDATLDFMLDNI